jgi:serine/threonine protein phosphatase 1
MPGLLQPAEEAAARQLAGVAFTNRVTAADARDYGRLIVHGHTPTRTGEPDLRTNRVDIDTGAVYGRALTAAVFDEDEMRPRGFLQASD